MERIYVLALIAATVEATVCLIGTRELLRFPASGTDRSQGVVSETLPRTGRNIRKNTLRFVDVFLFDVRQR